MTIETIEDEDSNLYKWFKSWSDLCLGNPNDISVKPTPNELVLSYIQGKYPYKSKKKRLVKKWMKRNSKLVGKYKISIKA